MKMQTRNRSAGWLAGSILIGAALLAPAAVLAQDGNQTGVGSETYTVSCTGGPGGTNITVSDTEVAWVFVHSGVSGPGTLTADFAGAGVVQADSYIQGGVKYLIVTDRPETLNSFSDDISGGVLTLSHVCRNELPTPTPTATPTEPVVTPTPTATPQGGTQPTPTPTATPQGGTQPTPTPSSSVEAATGTPKVTPPPTDSMGGGSSSGSGWGIALLALGGLAALALVATPARRRNR
jgi:hypothetical protein